MDELNLLETPTCQIISPDHLAWDLDLDGSEFPIVVSPLVEHSSYTMNDLLAEKLFVFSNTFVLSSGSYGPHNDIELD